MSSFLVMGDFNEIMKIEERNRVLMVTRSMLDFRS